MQRSDKLLYVLYRFGKEFCFQTQYAVLCSQYLLFILLELLGDVSLCLCECLLAHPLLWHVVLEDVANFEVVSEDVVVAYLEACYASALYLALLHL